MNIFGFLLLIALFLIMLYFTIRIAVRHAIKDSLEEIESIMKKAAKASINEVNWLENQ